MRFTLLTVFIALLFGVPATAQTPNWQSAILGAHTLASIYFAYDNGTRSDPYGPEVKGTFMATKDRFSFQIMGARPKFAANNRWAGSPDENAADIRATESIFGTYSIDNANHAIVLHMERAIFPNWDGTDRVYTLAMNGGQIEMVGPSTPSPQGPFQPHLVWK